MRQVTFNESISEIEIHPTDTYQTFQKLAKTAYGELDASQFSDLSCCPACGSTQITQDFTIWDATYYECANCDSLFIKNRPNPDQIRWYLDESQTAQFRKSPEYLMAMESNYRKLSSYRANWISAVTLRIPSSHKLTIVDVETRVNELFSSIHQQMDADVTTIHPLFTGESSATIVNSLDDLIDESTTILTAFDIFEHQYSPQQFMREVFSKIKPGGYFLMTTRAGSGFDIQTLRGQCPTIVPIEHINLFSVEGIQHLLTEVGFDILEISTPGQLDVQIVEQVLQKPTPNPIPKAIQYFLKNRDQYAKQNLQQFLQTNLLSSHLRLIAQKKDRKSHG